MVFCYQRIGSFLFRSGFLSRTFIPFHIPGNKFSVIKSKKGNAVISVRVLALFTLLSHGFLIFGFYSFCCGNNPCSIIALYW